MERTVEKLLFASRWILAPVYLGMSLAAFHLWRRVDGWRRARAGVPPVSPQRRQFLARAAVGGAGLVAAGFSAYGVRRAFAPPKIDELAVRVPRLHRAFDGMRIEMDDTLPHDLYMDINYAEAGPVDGAFNPVNVPEPAALAGAALAIAMIIRRGRRRSANLGS